MADIFDLVKSIPEAKPETSFDPKTAHEAIKINLQVKPARAPLAISIGEDDREYMGKRYPLRFGTYGNISMIKGEEKSRKTWFKSLLLGCALGGNSNIYSDDIKGHELSDKYILDIDTEQDKYDNWMTANRLPMMIGSTNKPIYPENYVPLNLREYSASHRRQYLEWIFMESEYRKKLGVVSIDGYVDLMDDFNSNLESISFTQSLMTYSTMSNCHITGVLHLNPGTEKARGHLGTILQQKCETVVIVKAYDDYSEIICQRARGKKFQTFSIGVNDDWLPYKIDGQFFNEVPKPKFN